MFKKVGLIFLVIISIGAMSIGAYIFIQPFYDIEVRDEMKEEIISEYEEQINSNDIVSDGKGNVSTIDSLQQQESSNYYWPTPEEALNNLVILTSEDGRDNSYKGVVDGILEIPSIEVKEAIIRGDRDYNLAWPRYHICTAEPYMKLDETKYVIYGHNYHIYGHLFNRLSELTDGDQVTINTDHGIFQYTVIDNRYVDRPKAGEEIVYNDDVGGYGYLYLMSCEEYLQPGYTMKRLVTVTCLLNEMLE